LEWLARQSRCSRKASPSNGEWGAGLDFSTRLLTDVTGPFYTVVLELTVPNLAAFEGAAPQFLGDKDWQANDQKVASLVESGSREIFTVVE
jgi:hypothetical protein